MVAALSHVVRLYTDTLAARAEAAHPARVRGIYVADGMATLACDGAMATLAAHSGWAASGALTVRAGAAGARLLRYELTRGGAADGAVTLEHELVLDAPPYLLRLDKVELPPGGKAYRHQHQGGGIRCLLYGGFTIESEGKTTRIGPGEAWFERGPDPVFAYAPDDKPAGFARMMILPRALVGKSSIRYLDPEDQAKPKPQTYTVYVDQPIDLP